MKFRSFLWAILAGFFMFGIMPYAYSAMANEDTVTSEVIASEAPQPAPVPVKPNPRIMIITVEYVDGIEQPASITQNESERKFIDSDFSLIDESQREMIKEKDAVLSFSNPDKAAALGRNYGAEIVVVIETKSNVVDTSQPYGVTVFAYECNATGKAVKVDTAEVITSHSSKAIERGGGRISTANKSCETAVSELADMVINDINQKTKGDVYKETTVQLVLSNADYMKVKELVKALDEQRSIKAVHERSLEKNTAVVDVELLGSADFLADLLIGMQNGPLVTITGKTANRIDLEFIE
jgi:hypothetical protein